MVNLIIDPSLRQVLLNNKDDAKVKMRRKMCTVFRSTRKEYVYSFLSEMMVCCKDHFNCLDNLKGSVLSDTMKPKLMSVIAYLSCAN
jgi:hypothetical protein